MSTISQRAFSGGELDPALHARVDFNKYYTGAKKLLNWKVKQQGGIENREGTEFVGEVKTSSLSTRLVPFDAGSGAEYAIEFGNEYVRFIKNGSYVTLTAQNIVAISAANPAVVEYSGADTYAAGDHIYFSSVAGSLGNYLNGRTLRVGTVTAGSNVFNLLNLDGTNFNSSSLPAYTSGGTIAEIYTVTTTYQTADLFDLQVAQSVDVLTIAHPTYPPRNLTRTSDASWAIADISFVPTIGTPTVSAAKGGTSSSGSVGYYYLATAVSATTFEESLAGGLGISQITNSIATLTPDDYINVSIGGGGVAGAGSYNFYKSFNAAGPYGYIGSTISSSTPLKDYGIQPDFTNVAPSAVAQGDFGSSNNYPSAVAYSKQRLFFGNSNNNKEAVWGTKVGLYTNTERNFPIKSDDAVLFKAANKKFNPIRHILDLSKMVLMTENSEIVVNGDGSVITPSNINLSTPTYNGCSKIPPLVINDNALYVQKNLNIIRDLLFDYQIDGYSGNDLSIFAKHLFEGFTIVDWCYQKNPDSIVWAVRSDGKVLSLTYLREQQVLAWTQHEFENGFVESCCSVPSTSKDDVYFIIKRTINSKTVRYVERLSDRLVLAAKNKTVTVAGSSVIRTYDSSNEVKIMDSSLSYDGRASTATVTITQGSGWTVSDTVNVEVSDSSFVSTDVDNEIHVYTSTGAVIRLKITAYVDADNVTCKPLDADVPSELQSVATTDWGMAVDELNGLWHLEGQDVSVLGDGYVVHSPNNEKYSIKTVTNGSITLNEFFVVIHVGLPITADFQTLNIDTIDGETMIDKKINIQKVTLFLNKTRGLFAGKDENGDLQEIKMREEEDYDKPNSLKNGPADVTIESDWNSTGSVFVRQIDPIPANILSIHPSGYIPKR